MIYRLISPVNNQNGNIVHDNDKGRAEIIRNYVLQPPAIYKFFIRKSYNQLKSYIDNDLSNSLQSSFNQSADITESLRRHKQCLSNLLTEIIEGRKVIGDLGQLYFSPTLFDEMRHFAFPPKNS